MLIPFVPILKYIITLINLWNELLNKIVASMKTMNFNE